MDDFERLGLKSGASKDAIQTAYKVKLLKYQKLGADRTENDEAEFKEIDEAYNRLCGYDIKIEEEPHSKIKDFFYYNKEKVFIALFVVFILGIFFVQLGQNVDYDINVALIGNIKNDKTGDPIGQYEIGAIGKFAKDKVTEINEPLVDFYKRSLIFAQNQDQYYTTIQQKLITRIQTGELDLLILDEENYEDFCEMGFLFKLDDYIAEYTAGNQLPESYKVEGYGKDLEGTYGISLDGTRYVESLELNYTGDLIACICVTSKNRDIAFSLIEQLTFNFKE